jgi:hypothetical protein
VEATTTTVVATLNSPLITGVGLKGNTESTVNCLSGLAHFTQLAVDTPGFEFTLTFSIDSFIRVTSTLFSVSGPPVALKLLSESRIALDATWIGGVQNTKSIFALVIDAGGNPSFARNGTVRAEIIEFGFTLSGEVQVPIRKGIAVFQNLVVDKIGSPRLRFKYTSNTLLDHTESLEYFSNPIQVMSGRAYQLAMTEQPGWSKNEGGTPFPWQPVLQVQDAGGNAVAHLVAVTASLAELATPAAAATGTTIQTTQTSGQLVFTNLAIDLVGTGYRLRFWAPGLLDVVSSTLDVSAGPPSRLAVISQPSITYSGLAYPFLLHVQDAGGNFAVGNCTTIEASVFTYAVDKSLYPATDFVLTSPAAAINGIAFFPSVMMPIALPFIKLTFQCAQPGVSWGAAVSRQFSVGPSLAVANCPQLAEGVLSSPTSCGPPEFRSTVLVLESWTQMANVGQVLSPVLQMRDNDGMPIDVPARTVYARLAYTVPSIPVEAGRIQGVRMESNYSSSVTFRNLQTDAAGQMSLHFVAGFASGLCLRSRSVSIAIVSASPTALNFLEYLPTRIVLRSTARTTLQLKDAFDNVANGVIATCRVGLFLYSFPCI